MPTSTDKNIGNPIFNVLTRSIYDSITPNADEFYLITDDAPITAGTGLTASMSGGSVVIDHTNTVSAKTVQEVYPITFDSEGHITSAGSAIDLSEVGGGGNTFIVEVTYTSAGEYSNFSCTGPELIQAYEDNQNIILIIHTTILGYSGRTNKTQQLHLVEVDPDQGLFKFYATRPISTTGMIYVEIMASSSTIYVYYSGMSSAAEESHAHGKISRLGEITDTTTIGQNSRLLITPSRSTATNTATIYASTLVFDGSTTSQALSKAGTFESYVKTASVTSTSVVISATYTAATENLTITTSTISVISG